MKFSEQWLREWVQPDWDTDTLISQITMAGLEVDAVEAAAGAFTDVVVAEITEAKPHPDADKLQVCSVNDGEQSWQVVCGAPNARAGLKAPLARVGAKLPGDFKIKKAKLRGVESFGMLCAEQELGLSEENAGLMELAADAPVGSSLRDYLGLDDQLIEVDLTPNRADCLSIRGIARDVAAQSGAALTPPAIESVAASIDDSFDIDIHKGEDCPRYAGRVIRNIDPTATTPLWLQEKLRRSGLRSIDPVGDVTNFVLLELGQPMHAFDLAKLEGGIVVRGAEADEPLTLLDGQEIKLKQGDLVIADHKKALALAGIMGGAGSAVSDDTRDLFLESAFFAPERIAGRARSYGLHTDSSHRFERGVDPEMAAVAIERATQLILDIAGGEAGPVVQMTQADHLPAVGDVLLRPGSIERMLGKKISAERVTAILSGLGFELRTDQQGWRVSVPSWRFDVTLEVDLLEELARIEGYNSLPSISVTDTPQSLRRTEKQRSIRALRQQLLARDYQEAITYSFVDPKWQAAILPDHSSIELMNPISSEMSVMRGSLLPGLLQAVAYNQKRQHPRVRLFESGLVFAQNGDERIQIPKIAAVASGRRHPESWAEGGEGVDFYDIKGDLESLLPELGQSAWGFERGEHPAMHPGQTARCLRNGKAVGWVGALHPRVIKALDLQAPVLAFEIDLEALSESRIPHFAPISRFPSLRRDIAVIVDRKVDAAALMETAKSAAGEHLIDLMCFDTYEGKGIDPQRKSLALGLTFQDSSRTLNDEDVSVAVEAVVKALSDQYGAQLRN